MSNTASPVSSPDMPPTQFVIESEWSWLRAACSETISPTGNPPSILPRWPVLFDLADRNGVQPLLYQFLSSSGGSVPPEMLQVLQRLYQTNLHKSLFLARELIRLVDGLAEAGIEVLPYKGIALAQAFYGDIALRQAGDIDLLIHARDLSRIREVVGALGYRPHSTMSAAEEHFYLKSGYECAFDGPSGRNLLEVQWAVQPRFYAVDFDHEGLFRRAVTITVAGHPMRTPSPEDSFVILSLHAAKHVWGRLIWLSDLALIIRRPELNWDWIGSQAKVLGIARILRVTLLLVQRLLSSEIPARAEASLPEDRQATSLVDEIEDHLVSGNKYNVESIAYFQLMLRLRENPSHRLQFVSRLAFTPGPGEWEAVRLPQTLFPLYRLVRLCRLAKRLAGG